ncbi:ABC transporter permease [Knoellia sinensis KCTC 19936]|uniref:ABC transporter permease n=1 Tax=Knoellia sinensis KCTC 19936 TaxID=1385520 RepID=A0A0A0J9Y5_9MICO|nr:ABC transporter permease [Knoellia sinensis]KGN32411.1 ABC transporter permease [Knoellia sinensis KCTC 19936]
MAARESENEFTTTHHVYEPHTAGLPPIRSYATELWRRREFAAAASQANLRAANTMTVFGQLWMVLNPLLLAGVYFLLVNILSGGGRGMDFFARLTAGLFTFYFVQGAMTNGAGSVIGGGKLLLNTAFPRLLMPFSAVRTAFFRWLPTVPIYFVFHIWAGNPWKWQMLAAIPFLFLIVIFSMGLAALFGALQVYFRDTSSFLPYLNRIWLYASPVLWQITDLPARMAGVAPILETVNPLFSLLGGYTEALTQGIIPDFKVWVIATIWAVASFTIGSLFFISREREFAVRL